MKGWHPIPHIQRKHTNVTAIYSISCGEKSRLYISDGSWIAITWESIGVAQLHIGVLNDAILNIF